MHATRQWGRAVISTTITLCAAQVYGACTFGTSNQTSLQEVFDSVLAPGSLSATNDCLPADGDNLWTAEGRATTIVIELSRYANKGSALGIYDALNPESRVSLFTGGVPRILELVPSGGGYDVVADDVVEGHFASGAFGFFVRGRWNQTFFSDPTLNSDEADHLYAYRGNGDSFTGGPLAGTVFATSMYMLAFENRRVPSGGLEFPDLVATISFVAPMVAAIPLPASVWLLGGLLALFGLWQRRVVADSTLN